MSRRESSGAGLQDRVWEPLRLTWRERALWAWFLVYMMGLVLIARRIGARVRGWPGFVTMIACMALGMLVWRRSLAARFKRMSTVAGYWALRCAYWALFAPWAFLMQRKDPLQMRSASSLSWTERPQELTTLSEAQRQY